MNNEIYTTQTEEQVTAVTTDIVIDATPTKDSTNAVSSGGVYSFVEEQLHMRLIYKGEREVDSWFYLPGSEHAVGDVYYVPSHNKYYVYTEDTMNRWKIISLSSVLRDILDETNIVNNVKASRFGAVGDGETDDTAAIQAALNAGGIVYFPAGRYKATKQLTATTPCTIVMEGMYPSCDEADYPINGVGFIDSGARIETYVSTVGEESTEDASTESDTAENESTEDTSAESGSAEDETTPCGLLIGDGVNVDGLAIRAMEGFQGVVLKYDGTQGRRTYPSQTRLKHIRIDCASASVQPISMFDFNPYKTYGVIVEDVTIGTNHSWTYATYGWRTELADYANSICLKNIIIDMAAEYPLLIKTNGHQAMNWTFSNVIVQAYRYIQDNGELMNRVPHENLVTLHGLYRPYFNGCFLWDVGDALANEGISGDVIVASIQKATAVGNDEYFDALDTVVKLPVKRVKDIAYDHILEVGNGRIVSVGNNVLNPQMRTLTQENVALAGETDGQFIAYDFEHDGCVNGAILSTPSESNSAWFKEGMWTKCDGYWTTSLIPCGVGDVVRFYYYGDQDQKTEAEGVFTFNADDRDLAWRKGVVVCEYDGSGANCLRYVGEDMIIAEYTVMDPKTEFIRVTFCDSGPYPISFDDRTDYFMATVNYPLDLTQIKRSEDYKTGQDATGYSDDAEWAALTGIERYSEETTPELLSQLTLTSPDGTKYRLTVSNDRQLSVEPVTAT